MWFLNLKNKTLLRFQFVFLIILLGGDKNNSKKFHSAAGENKETILQWN